MDIFGNTAHSEAAMSPETNEDTVVSWPVQSVKSIPINQETTTMDTPFNPDDANAVSRFFQGIADKVVLASTLPAEVAELRKVVEQLKADVESYREHMARADEEISNLRRERAQLQDENARLQADLATETRDHGLSKSRWEQACNERDRWHNDFISASTDLDNVKREKDDAQLHIMELEDMVRRLSEDKDYIQRQHDDVHNRLNSIRSALA